VLNFSSSFLIFSFFLFIHPSFLQKKALAS
jgi:hypothetical protein